MASGEDGVPYLLHDAADILALIAADPWMMRALEAAATLRLPDCWLVAGFVRAKVWDALHGYATRTMPGDIDVVFFDPARPPEADAKIETALKKINSGYPWEVCNQAHMHRYNDDAPYEDSVDAISRWAETVSTIGVRIAGNGRLELAAPHGVDDLFAMVIRPTPHPDAKREVFEKRLAEKDWRRLWPKVHIESNSPKH